MTEQFTSVQEPLEYIESNFTPWVFRVVKRLARLYAKHVLGIRAIHVEGMDLYLDQYREFLDGKARLAIAFRHPTATDPQAVWYFASHLAPKAAKKAGINVPSITNASFLYGRGVPLWAGKFVKWLLPRIGAYQLYHRKMDAKGMRMIRKAFATGQFPLVMAPEGQVTYHNYRVAELEQGVARMALWCLEDLQRMGEDQDVVIIPLALIYDFTGKDPDSKIDSILKICEKKCGLMSTVTSPYERIHRLLEHITSILETYYSTYFGAKLDTTADMQRRIDGVVKAAMETAESLYRIKGHGDIIPRLFTVRQAFWDDVFREDIGDVSRLSEVDKGIADRIAGTSYYASRHLELVDNLVYIDISYIDKPASKNRLIEMALNIHGVIGRITGGDISSRILEKNELTFRVGNPISIKEFTDVPLSGRKRQIRDITATLYSRLNELSQERVTEEQL